MKSKWMVTCNFINKSNVYFAYRLIDKNGVDHSGNREVDTEFHRDIRLAMKRAEELNRMEETK